MNRKVALSACSVFGFIMFAQYFSSHPIARTVNQAVLEYWQIIFAFTLLVGIVGYLRHSFTQMKKPGNRIYTAAGLVGMVAMPSVAIIWGIKADTPFMWLFENVQAPLQATVFALLAFYVASASFRGFRARSTQAVVLLLAASIILISRSALGGIIGDWLPELSQWIRNYPSMAARRAILIGIGLGSVTTSLRVILGIERTWLGGEQ